MSARRDDGRGSDVRGSGGDRSSRSGIISCVGPGLLGVLRSIERGGGSDRFSVDEEAVLGVYVACLACEKAATAAKFEEAVGRV